MSANVDVFEVGKQQLWDWTQWEFRNKFVPRAIQCDADSLRKGIYVVVECCAKFGRVAKPHIMFSFTSKREAVAYAERQDDIQNCPRYMDVNDIVIGYEVWHVVDDAELWQTWEHDVEVAKRKASACRISLDNGYTFLDPVRDDLDFRELVAYLDEFPSDWDTIVNIMDDETREFTHLTSSYTGKMPDKCMSTAKINAMWLCDYLMNAGQDLIR